MAKGFRIGYPEETVAWRVLDFEPKFIRERWADPLYPVKRDLARIFRWPRRR